MKTKKRQSILLCLLLAALLCACGQERSAPAETGEAPESETVTVIEELRPTDEFGRAESLAMANALCANRALLSGEYLYTLEFDEQLSPVLGRYRVVDNTLREFTVLVENCVAEYLTEFDGALYYLNDGCLERLDADGGRSLLAEDAYSLQISGGRLYFLDGEGRFCRAELDGSGRTVLLEDKCAYPYVMDGLLLVQKGEDEALFLCEPEGEAAWRLTEGAAWAPLRVGQTLYFTAGTAEGKRLCAIDLEDGGLRTLSETPLRGAAEFFYAGGWQTRLALQGDLLRQQILPVEGGEAEDCAYSGYHLLDYVGAGLRVDAVYEAGGRLNSFMLYTPDGGVIRYFGGKVIE